MKRIDLRSHIRSDRKIALSRIIYLNDYLFVKYANYGVSGCLLLCLFLFFFLALTSNLLSFEQINGNTNKKNVPFSCTQTTETSKTHVIFQGCVGRIYEYKSRGIIYFQLILKQSFQKNQKHKI